MTSSSFRQFFPDENLPCIRPALQTCAISAGDTTPRWRRTRLCRIVDIARRLPASTLRPRSNSSIKGRSGILRRERIHTVAEREGTAVVADDNKPSLLQQYVALKQRLVVRLEVVRPRADRCCCVDGAHVSRVADLAATRRGLGGSGQGSRLATFQTCDSARPHVLLAHPRGHDLLGKQRACSAAVQAASSRSKHATGYRPKTNIRSAASILGCSRRTLDVTSQRSIYFSAFSAHATRIDEAAARSALHSCAQHHRCCVRIGRRFLSAPTMIPRITPSYVVVDELGLRA